MSLLEKATRYDIKNFQSTTLARETGTDKDIISTENLDKFNFAEPHIINLLLDVFNLEEQDLLHEDINAKIKYVLGVSKFYSDDLEEYLKDLRIDAISNNQDNILDSSYSILRLLESRRKGLKELERIDIQLEILQLPNRENEDSNLI